MTINGSDSDEVPVDVGPKKFYIQLGDMPLGLTRRINASQVRNDLGITIPGHIGGVLKSVQDRALYFFSESIGLFHYGK